MAGVPPRLELVFVHVRRGILRRGPRQSQSIPVVFACHGGFRRLLRNLPPLGAATRRSPWMGRIGGIYLSDRTCCGIRQKVMGWPHTRPPTGHETEHVMSQSNQNEHKSGKDIRLTEYAACAG